MNTIEEQIEEAEKAAAEKRAERIEKQANVYNVIEERLKEWKESPDKMFAWRSRMFRTIMIILEEIITREVGGNRTKENARVRAIGQFQQIAAAMEEYRMDTPVVCPYCTKEFNLE